MKLNLFIFFWVFHAGVSFSLVGQDFLKPPVVLIRSTDAEGLEESGTGFVVGKEGNSLFILTAKHVLANNRPTLQFFNGSEAVGELVNSLPEPLDFAAIRCELPPSFKIAASYALAQQAPPPGTPGLKAIGHPVNATWRIAYNQTFIEDSPNFLDDLFTFTGQGIRRGNSGGPVLNVQNEIIGMVQKVDGQEATCLDLDKILEICTSWGVPLNLMTGVFEQVNTEPEPLDTRMILLRQQAETAYNSRQWETALKAYQELQGTEPTDTYQSRIRICEAELEKDRNYDRHLKAGIQSLDLEEALGHYRSAQKERDTPQIQLLITETEKKLRELKATRSLPHASGEQPGYTDPLAGEFVWIEGGIFEMGSEEGDGDEKPIHPVQVADFYMGKFEVRQGIWEKVMGTNPSRFKGCPQCPVESVSWEEVQDFIQRLNHQSRYTYRLPTEAEWAYAAGGGSGNRTTYAGTSEVSQLFRYGNFCDKGCSISWATKDQDDGFQHAAPVGRFLSNALGLFDMSGNVWEWCQDRYHDTYQGAPSDGSAWESGDDGRRVLRGGSWYDGPVFLRVAYRDSGTPTDRDGSIGFRLARTP